MSYDWAPSLVSALVTVIVTLTGLILYLRKTMPTNGNGCKLLDEKFTAQVGKCTERFMEMAEERGEVKTNLDNLSKQLDRIEGRLKRRRAV